MFNNKQRQGFEVCVKISLQPRCKKDHCLHKLAEFYIPAEITLGY